MSPARFAAVALVALACGSPAWAQDTQPADARAILQQFVDATGGVEAYEAVKSQKQVGTLELPAMGITGELKILTRQPADIRITIDLPGVGLFEQGVIDGVGWAIDPFNGPRIMSEGERLMLIGVVEVPVPDDLEATATGEAEDVELHDGTTASARRVDVTTQSGVVVSSWYDVETKVRIKRSAEWNGDFGPESQSTLFDNWQPMNGADLVVPMASHQTVSGSALAIKITEAMANPELPDDAFAMPEAVAKLVAE